MKITTKSNEEIILNQPHAVIETSRLTKFKQEQQSQNRKYYPSCFLTFPSHFILFVLL